MSAIPDSPARSMALFHAKDSATPSSRASSISPPHVASPQNPMRWDPSALSGTSRDMHAGERRPTYFGYIKTPADAILLLAACDLPDMPKDSGMEPPPRRISRRLLDDERAALIRSGSIFVWDEREAGMRRWTDGHCWSASRVSGCFLTYRELEMRKKNTENTKDAPRGNLYKPDGLIKQSFSITTASNRKLHVISYFRKNDVRMGLLQRVSKDPRITGRGPDSWNVQVDEEEFGELLNRETEHLPNHIVMDGKQNLYMEDEKRAMKRSLSDDSSLASSPPAPEEPEQAMRPYPLPRPAAMHYPSYDRGYMRYPPMNRNYMLRDDVMTMKRYRYDRSHSPPYPYYAEQRGWAPRYETPSQVSPMTPPLSSPATVGYKTYPKPMPYAYSSSRPQLPPLQLPRASEAEKGTLEALASLRADVSKYPTHPPALPYKATGNGPLRARFTPVSATDRHTLQKLSVPM